tara:strand:+ start:447 stop:617 length:171 start_codon:yes stop_codon:yes gene_type:complete
MKIGFIFPSSEYLHSVYTLDYNEKASIQAMKEWKKKRSELFTKNIYNLTEPDNSPR